MLRTTVLLGALLASFAASAADFVVIVNEGNKTTTIAAKDVAGYFLKKKAKWADGTKVMPVVPPETNAATIAFDKQILNKSAAALRAYWQQEIFSGRNTPPVEKPDDAEVIAYVRKNAGAIGFISASAARDGVRVVNVTE